MLTWVKFTPYLAVVCLGFHALASGAPEAPKPPPAPYRTVSLSYYHPVPGSAHEAMRHEIADLTPGAYVIRWKHRMKLAANRLPPPYRLEVTNARTGVVRRSWDVPFPVTERMTAHALVFCPTEEDCREPMAITLVPKNGIARAYCILDYSLAKAGLETDADRDGAIRPGETATSRQPLRLWINDDADESEWQADGDRPAAGGRLDADDAVINGLRDLVDFFPLNLRLAELVREHPPEEGYAYLLRQKDRALGFVWTSLPPGQVGRIHREPDLKVFGRTFVEGLGAAQVEQPDAAGMVEIPADFLRRIQKAGQGVVLLEGRRATAEPLELVVVKGGAEIMKLPMPLRVTPVETMYRHLAAAERPAAAGRPTATGEPAGLPDAELGERWCFFLHGYNVSADNARGWQAETFKRLYALGSRARFVGVTWDGDTGLDYHRAVFLALETGLALPARLRQFGADERSVVVAHSLGNAVVSRAVQAGYTPARYLMLNAALPVESVSREDATMAQAREMTEANWRPYERRLYASEWWKKFAPEDPRRALTWAGAFRRVKEAGVAVNYYSEGEDITVCPVGMKSASVLGTFWDGRTLDYGAWKTQELLKGVDWTTSLGSLAMRGDQAGWGFNRAWNLRKVTSGPGRPEVRHERRAPSQAAALGEDDLRRQPFFRPFLGSVLRPGASEQPEAMTSTAWHEALASGVPAMSYAIGGMPMRSLAALGVRPTPARNFSLEAEGRARDVRWPSEGHRKKHEVGRWLHSDFKNVALPFVHPLYVSMIAEGGLR
jgi:hypothetical protein